MHALAPLPLLSNGPPHDRAVRMPRHIIRKHGLLAELQRLASLSETPGSLDTHLHELSRAAARLLGAEQCVIVLLSEDDAVNGEAFDSAITAGASDGVLCAPIRGSGRVIGVVRVSGVRGKSCFDHEDRWLLEIVTVYIGKSLQTVQLQNILQSRFAQFALVRNADNAVGQVLASVPDPARMAKILAKSFYREMNKAGFGANEVIAAASEIIAELSASLKNHAKL